MSNQIDLDRRELLKRTAALAAVAAGAAIAGPRQASAEDADTLHFFPAGFKHEHVKTSGAEINVVRGGDGPPLLLIHGAPQSHVSWHKVAPDFAKITRSSCPICVGMATAANRPTHPITRTTRSARWRSTWSK